MRAYTEASKAAVEAAKIVMNRFMVPFSITTNYTDLGKIQYLLGSEKIAVLDSEYGENVVLRTEIYIDDVERIEKALIEATAARAKITKKDAVFTVQNL